MVLDTRRPRTAAAGAATVRLLGGDLAAPGERTHPVVASLPV